MEQGHTKAGTRIKLLNCSAEILESILWGDDYLSEMLNLEIAENWATFGDQVFRGALQRIEDDPFTQKWELYLVILTEYNLLIGNGGFKGAPDSAGMVELGYEIAKDWQNKGYATELVELLLKKAFQSKEVQSVIAHTVESDNASARVLYKNGFRLFGQFNVEEDGDVYRWILPRNDWEHMV